MRKHLLSGKKPEHDLSFGKRVHLLQNQTLSSTCRFKKEEIRSMLTAIIWWLIVGLIAGFLASVVMRGGGYGIVGDIIAGLIGAFVGGFLANLLGLGASGQRAE